MNFDSPIIPNEQGMVHKNPQNCPKANPKRFKQVASPLPYRINLSNRFDLLEEEGEEDETPNRFDLLEEEINTEPTVPAKKEW